MRTIKYTSQFKRDFKREKKSARYRKTLEKDLLSTVELLAEDKPLPHRYYDHSLSGEWQDHRDCHIKPDLVLIERMKKTFSYGIVVTISSTTHAADQFIFRQQCLKSVTGILAASIRMMP